MRRVLGVVRACFLSVATLVSAAESTDDQIAEKVIQESIAAYKGVCPCPYSPDSRGKPCGRRSAYSRPGGLKPKCFREDVTPADIENYRRTHPN